MFLHVPQDIFNIYCIRLSITHLKDDNSNFMYLKSC